MLFHLYRPDRMCYAVTSFIEEKLGPKYVENRTIEFAKSYEEASPSTPIFFILSPGVNPLKDVEALGHVLGYTADNGNFHNVSLGMQFVTCLNIMKINQKYEHFELNKTDVIQVKAKKLWPKLQWKKQPNLVTGLFYKIYI